VSTRKKRKEIREIPSSAKTKGIGDIQSIWPHISPDRIRAKEQTVSSDI
jgi:hypothetical protein